MGAARAGHPHARLAVSSWWRSSAYASASGAGTDCFTSPDRGRAAGGSQPPPWTHRPSCQVPARASRGRRTATPMAVGHGRWLRGSCPLGSRRPCGRRSPATMRLKFMVKDPSWPTLDGHCKRGPLQARAPQPARPRQYLPAGTRLHPRSRPSGPGCRPASRLAVSPWWRSRAKAPASGWSCRRAAASCFTRQRQGSLSAPGRRPSCRGPRMRRNSVMPAAVAPGCRLRGSCPPGSRRPCG